MPVLTKPRPPAAAPTPVAASTPAAASARRPRRRVRVALPAPRCPYCHDDVRAGEAQHGCPGCRAWHHAACWSERAGRCAACGHDDGAAFERAVELERRLRRRAAPEPLPVPLTLLGAWVLLLAAVPAFKGLVLPAFSEMFQDVGVRLPLATQVALGPWSWLLAMLPFTALFLGALASTARGRERGGGAAMLLTFGLALFYVYALFCPLVQLCTRL